MPESRITARQIVYIELKWATYGLRSAMDVAGIITVKSVGKRSFSVESISFELFNRSHRPFEFERPPQGPQSLCCKPMRSHTDIGHIRLDGRPPVTSISAAIRMVPLPANGLSVLLPASQIRTSCRIHSAGCLSDNAYRLYVPTHGRYPTA